MGSIRFRLERWRDRLPAAWAMLRGREVEVRFRYVTSGARMRQGRMAVSVLMEGGKP